MFFAEPIAHLLFTDRYPEAATFLRLFAVSYAFYALPYDSWARATGRTTWILKTVAVFAVISLTLVLSGVSLFGPIGALGGFLIAQLSLRFFSMFEMHRALRWKIRDFIPIRDLATFTLASLAIGSVSFGIYRSIDNEIVGLLTGGGFFWLCYLTTVVPLAEKSLRKERASDRVLMLTQFLHIGGLETMILNLSRDLESRTDWKPFVFVYDEAHSVATLEPSFGPIPVYRWNKGQGVSLKLVWKIVQYTRENEIDVIHAHDMGPLLYSVLAKFLSFGRLRVVFTQHSFVHLQHEKRYSLYEKIFSRLADQICVVSSPLREGYAALGVNPKTVTVIENGVPFAEPLASADEKSALRKILLPTSLHSNKLWILSLARLHPGKGQDYLIEVWSKLSQTTREKCLLVFVGSETSLGFQHRLEVKALAVGKDDLYFAGPTREPQQWLKASDAFVSASSEEGLPLGPIEAMGAGLPVFASQIEGHMTLGNTPFFFVLGDPVQTARLFEKWLGDLHEGKLATKPADEIRSRFSLRRMTNQYVEIYEKVRG